MKKIFTLAAAVLASFSLWAAPVVGTYTTRTISNNDLTSTWAFDVVSGSAVKLGADPVTDNEMVFAPSAKDKMQFATSNYLSCQAQSSIYIPVPAEGAGSVSLTMGSSSDSRYFQLYINGTAAADTKRLWSKYSETPTSDGKKGPQSFSFTAADLTTREGKKYLHFKDNNTEMKVASFTVTLTTGTYADCTDPEFTVSPTEGTGFVGDPINIAVTSKNQSKPINSVVTVDGVPGVYGTDYTFSASTGLVQATPLKAGTFVITFSQASNDTYCEAEESATFVISEKTPVASVTIDGPASGFIGDELVYTATAVGATAYEWYLDGNKQGSDSAKFIYTAVKGNHNIVCKARNQFNAENEWIASEAKVLTVTTLCGELIKAVHTGKTTATVTGLIGGTADKSTESGGKINSNGYFGIQLASGNFQEGDTLNVNIGAANTSAAVLIIYSEKTAENVILNTEVAGEVGDNKFVLPAAVNGKNALYIVRTADNAWNAVVNSISVIRPKAVDHADVALVGVAIDGEALPSDFVTHLINEGTFTILTSYVNAPVVAFVKHTDTYYEGETEPVSTNDSIKVTATDVDGQWQAQATIGENTYTINLAKASSFTVHYMDGTTELGTENVEANGTVAEYAKYQSKSLYSFVGWYTDVDLTTPANLEAQITAETYLYAKFEEKYATSINIEKAVMENGKGYAIINQLGTLGYASNITGSLDSLDNNKDQRNYAYLGLKVKQSGALLNFRLEAGKTVTIKFGEIKKTPNVSINGGAFADMAITDKVYTHTAEANELISIKMMDGNAVVFQQIMIGEELQAPALFAINCAEAQNGSVAAPFKLGIPGETVTLTVTPEDGYKVASVTVNGDAIEAVETVYSFVMPAAAANVAATFSTTTALDNTEASVKATKRIVNGQLLIEKNGVIYNAQGAVVR